MQRQSKRDIDCTEMAHTDVVPTGNSTGSRGNNNNSSLWEKLKAGARTYSETPTTQEVITDGNPLQPQ